MCGIAGVFDYRTTGYWLEPAVLDAMVDSLAHRGPNARGTWRGDGIWLGHRRLSILDPTPVGAQPMVHRSGSLVVTYNGEIYNYRELRAELAELGHGFHTDCDTEVLLAAYAAWGIDAVERFNGIFAFALWDASRRRLWLVRDRLGVKPLYYSLQGGVLRFGSEVKALLADPAFVRRPSAAGINAFLSYGFIPAPDTGFADVVQLLPAHDIVIEDGRLRERQYWRLSMQEHPIAPDEADEQFATQFGAAVARQMVSHVPIGGFLSGGIDSAAIAAEMAHATTLPVRTFSVGFNEASFDESSAARETAERIGSQHTSINVALDVEDTVERYLAQCDEPFADSSALAVYHLCQATARETTVALSGDGADDILGGYSTYSATHLAVGYRKLPHWSRRLIASAAAALPASDRRYNLAQFANRFVRGAEAGEGRDFSSWRVHFGGVEKNLLCKPDYFRGLGDPLEVYADHYRHAPDAGSRLKRMLYADTAFYLPSDMLVKVDRMSMAHGLEVRVPFLDHQFVEFCAGLPDRYLAQLPFPRRNKLILRRLVQRRLGDAVSRRKKTGFNVPIEKAMRTSLLARFCDTIGSSRFRSDGPFDTAALLKFAHGHVARRHDAGHALFSALVLADWWQRWLTATPTPAALPLRKTA